MSSVHGQKASVRECLNRLQAHYTQEEINTWENALFWTRGVQAAIRALEEEGLIEMIGDSDETKP